MGACQLCSSQAVSAEDVNTSAEAAENYSPTEGRLSTKEKQDFLSEVKLFQRLPKDQHIILSQITEEEHYNVGVVLIKQGDWGDEFFIIKSGVVSVKVDGQKVAELRGGDYMGENALLRDEPRNATITVESALTVLKITRSKFQEMKLNEKLEFKKRAAVAAGGSGGTASTKPPSVKTADDRSVMLKALQSNQNLTSIVALDDAKCNSMIDVAWEEEVKPGTDVIKQGSEEADYFYIVKKGKFEILLDKPNDAKSADSAVQQQVGVIQQGGSFGELALIFYAPRAATIRAQDASVVWVIDRDNFKRILQDSAAEAAKKNLKYLSADFFSVLREDEKVEIVKVLQDVEFKQGEVIFEQNDTSTGFFVLIDGSVALVKDGNETKKVQATPDKGELLGETVLLSSAPRAESAKVTSATAKALSMDKKSFELLLGPYEALKKRGAGGESMIGKTTTSGGTPTNKSKSDRPKIKRADLKTLGLLGCGGFGAVDLVEHQVTNDTYALKSLSKGHVVKCKMQKSTIQEKTIQYMCDSPFIVKLHECFNSDQHLMFLLELALGGELYDTYCKKGMHGKEEHARFYVASTVFAFEHLHGLNIVYRDLKPENLLIAEGGFVKLTDMGLAKVIVGKTNTTCGTPDYFAPEVIGSSGHGLAVDWWTLGILAFELMAGHPPFESPSPAATMKKIQAGISKVPFPPKLKGGLEDLVKGLLKKSPMDRLPMRKGGTDNIKKHSWYAGSGWSDAHWANMYQGKVDPPYKPKVKSKKDLANFSASPADKPPQIKYKDDGSGWDADFATSE